VTPLLAELRHHVTGSGDPVTLFGAGLGGSIAQRPGGMWIASGATPSVGS
jgi:hypothetical protein